MWGEVWSSMWGASESRRIANVGDPQNDVEFGKIVRLRWALGHFSINL